MPPAATTAALHASASTITHDLAPHYGHAAREPQPPGDDPLPDGGTSGPAIRVWGEMLHRLQQAEGPVRGGGPGGDYTGQWPATLASYRLIVLVVPGRNKKDDLFADQEVAALRGFVTSGGLLFMEDDYTFYAGTPVINDLLTRLGVTVREQARTSAVAAPTGC